MGLYSDKTSLSFIVDNRRDPPPFSPLNPIEIGKISPENGISFFFLEFLERILIPPTPLRISQKINRCFLDILDTQQPGEEPDTIMTETELMCDTELMQLISVDDIDLSLTQLEEIEPKLEENLQVDCDGHYQIKGSVIRYYRK